MEVDANGRPQPTGKLETLQADRLVLALGQEVDTTVLDSIPGVILEDGVVQVGKNMMTGAEGVFAGGDMVPSERTVTIATGHGKKAARHIDAWLRGSEYTQATLQPAVDYAALHLHYLHRGTATPAGPAARGATHTGFQRGDGRLVQERGSI